MNRAVPLFPYMHSWCGQVEFSLKISTKHFSILYVSVPTDPWGPCAAGSAGPLYIFLVWLSLYRSASKRIVKIEHCKFQKSYQTPLDPSHIQMLASWCDSLGYFFFWYRSGKFKTADILFLSNATTCIYRLRGPPSWSWQKRNRLLSLGRPWGAVTLSRWCEWWYRRM